MLLRLGKTVINIRLGPDREGLGALETVERGHGRLFHPIGPAGGAEHAARKLVRQAMGRPAMISTAPRNVPAYKGYSAGLLQTGRPRGHAFGTFCWLAPKWGTVGRAG